MRPRLRDQRKPVAQLPIRERAKPMAELAASRGGDARAFLFSAPRDQRVTQDRDRFGAREMLRLGRFALTLRIHDSPPQPAERLSATSSECAWPCAMTKATAMSSRTITSPQKS